IDQIRHAGHQQPFLPFSIHTTGGGGHPYNRGAAIPCRASGFHRHFSDGANEHHLGRCASSLPRCSPGRPAFLSPDSGRSRLRSASRQGAAVIPSHDERIPMSLRFRIPRSRWIWTVALVVLCGASRAWAAAPEKVTTVEGITEYRLDNGLRVLLFPDLTRPKV